MTFIWGVPVENAAAYQGEEQSGHRKCRYLWEAPDGEGSRYRPHSKGNTSRLFDEELIAFGKDAAAQ